MKHKLLQVTCKKQLNFLPTFMFCMEARTGDSLFASLQNFKHRKWMIFFLHVIYVCIFQSVGRHQCTYFVKTRTLFVVAKLTLREFLFFSTGLTISSCLNIKIEKDIKKKEKQRNKLYSKTFNNLITFCSSCSAPCIFIDVRGAFKICQGTIKRIYFMFWDI